jgi:hypothetical protein
MSKGGSDSKLNLTRGTKLGSMTMISPHLWWQYGGWDVRFVGALVDVNNARQITDDLQAGANRTNRPIPSEQRGYYVQVAYDIFRLFKIDKQELYVFGIYEDFDAHAKVPQGSNKPAGHKLKVYNVGLSYKPHPLVAIKTDYARLNYSPNKKNENEYRLTLGFMF